MEEKYFQNSNGVEKLVWVSETQLNNLARDVDVVEVINNHNSDVKVRVVGKPVYKDGMLVGVGGE